MALARGDEAQGLAAGSLQEPGGSGLAEDKDEQKTAPEEEIQGLEPEDVEKSAPAEATQGSKAGTGQVRQRDALG